MTPAERQSRAITFRAAMEDGILSECLSSVENQFMNEWKVTFSSEERENIWRTIRVIQLMRSHMASIVAGERDGIAAIKRLK